ncbi:MAG TPA: quinoprotein dehydrogenase-associated SoxYZ-like carrier [Burkholderiales bacterium]
MIRVRCGVLLLALSLVAASLHASAADESQNPDTEIWRKVRAELFGERPLAEDGPIPRIRIEMPGRAADAAVVPLAIRVKPLPGEAPPRKLYLIIDRNPSPIAAVFEFGEGSGGAQVETRVRIEEYTWVRVVAEGADGSLLAARRYVKAAGGCSAPAGKSLAERLAGMGQMKWRVGEVSRAGEPLPVQLMIRHPNNSGLAMDQVTRLYDPPYYVRNVRVTRDGVLVLAADVDFSISENPAFSFTLRPGDGGPLRAQVTDSGDRTFESSTVVP